MKAVDLFDFAPISLWEEDYSQVKTLMDQVRSLGVADLRSYASEHPDFVTACMGAVRVLRVNRRTLELFGATSQEEIMRNLERIFRDDMQVHFLDELVDIWNGGSQHQLESVNYSLTGEPIDILLRWYALPGYETTLERVLVSLTDIRDRKRAEQSLITSEAHLRGLFEHSPISLWEEDYSLVKQHMDELRRQGVKDLRAYLGRNPEMTRVFMQSIRVLDVNQKTLELFDAPDKETLLSNLDRVFRDEMSRHFTDELVDMWDGRLHYEREGVNYSLGGRPIDIHLHWTVLPGYEDSLGRVMVSIIDVSARKKAEDYLKYLGTHDVLTGLYNRAYFEEELARLERGRRYPVSIAVIDVDGLKQVNDSLGHAAGDDVLRRAAEVLKSSFRSEDVVARIGGDEFSALLPATDAGAAAAAVKRIHRLIEVNNNFYQGPPLSVSAGYGTAQKGGNLTETLRIADDLMYQEKRKHKETRTAQ